MKTYIAKSHTNYGEVVYVINAPSLELASQIAGISGAWDGYDVEEIDTETFGLVGAFGGDG